MSEQIPSAEQQEKARKWAEIAARVDELKDALDKPVDEGIKEAVIALNALDIPTTQSCEGHLIRGSHAPYIDIEAVGEDMDEMEKKWRELEKEEKYEEAGPILEKIERRNLEERKKLVPLLDEFYQGHPAALLTRLIMQGVAAGLTRLESQGASLQQIATEDEKKANLENYQREMNDFKEFLKKKFFGQ